MHLPDRSGNHFYGQVEVETRAFDHERILPSRPSSCYAVEYCQLYCHVPSQNTLPFADEALPPWVNHNGKLHPLPKGQGGKGPKGQLELVFGPNGVMKFALFGELLSWPGRIRAGIGAFLGHAPPPEGKEANWIQTVPKKGWFCLLRLYSPTEPWFDKTWRPGEIELIK